MSRLFVGCPMWANRDWVGEYFPSSTRSGAELEAYAHVCTAVEGNTTFYALPDEATVGRWAEQTSPDFRFAFKLPRTITHDRRLLATEDEVAAFCRRFAPLLDRLGPCSIQLPASFAPSDLSTLDRFLSGLSSEFPWSVEVRHPDFCDGADTERRLNDVLIRHGAERIVLDSRALFAGPCETPGEIEAFGRKPRLPVRAIALGKHPIVRFIGQTDADANPPFWERWVTTAARWVSDDREPIFFLHTPDNRVSPALARRFHAEVAALVDGLTPLPDPLPEDQPSLFD